MWIELVVFELEAIADVGERLPCEVFGMSLALRRLVVAGVRVGVVTSLSRNAVHRALHKLGWMDIVDVCVTADDARPAPHPDMVERAIRTLGISSPARVASVSRTLRGLTQGATAGCSIVIGVTDRGASEVVNLESRALRRAPCTHVVPTPALVPEVLRRIERRPELAAGWDA